MEDYTEPEPNNAIVVRDKRQPGWFWVDNEIIYTYAKQMKPIALACYVYLAARANAQEQCWPSQRTMAEELGVDRGTIRSAVKKLSELKLIHVEIRRNDDGSHKSTIYTMLDIRGGGSIAQGGSYSPGVGRTTPNNTKENKTKENNISPEGETSVSAAEFVAQLDERLTDSLPALTKSRKARYGREFKEHITKGIDPGVLDEAVDRIVDRWADYQLSVEQAIRDNANGSQSSGNGRSGANPRKWQSVAAQGNLASLAGNGDDDRNRRTEGYEYLFALSPEEEDKLKRLQEEDGEA